MGWFMTMNAIGVLITSLIGLALAWVMARLMDRANSKVIARQRNHGWNAALTTIKTEPLATGVYYGLRWLGICLMIGLLFSRSV